MAEDKRKSIDDDKDEYYEAGVDLDEVGELPAEKPEANKDVDPLTAAKNNKPLPKYEKWVVIGSSDGSLRLWDIALEPPEQLRSEEGHKGAVTTIVANWSSREVVTGGADNRIAYWNLEGADQENVGWLPKFFDGHTAAISAVAVDFQQYLVLSASYDMTLKLWRIKRAVAGVAEASETEAQKTLKGHTSTVTSVCVDWEQNQAISAGCDKVIKMWDLEAETCLKDLTGHVGPVWVVRADFSKKKAVSGSTDRLLRLWDIENGSQISSFAGHGGPVTSLDVNWNNMRCMSASHDRSLKIWDLETKECLRTIGGHHGPVWCVTVDWKHEQSASSSGSGEHGFRVYDYGAGICWHACVPLSDEPNTVWALSVDWSGRQRLNRRKATIGRKNPNLERDLKADLIAKKAEKETAEKENAEKSAPDLPFQEEFGK